MRIQTIFPTLLLLITILLPAPAPAATPEERTRAYFDAMKSKNWDDVAAVFHPKAATRFRELMGVAGETPEELSEFLSTVFGMEADAAQLEAMTDSEFFTMFFKTVMSQAETYGEITFGDLTILGSIPEGDGMIHVLARSRASMGELSTERVEVLSFIKDGETWGLDLQAEMEGIAQQMKQAMEMMKAEGAGGAIDQEFMLSEPEGGDADTAGDKASEGETAPEAE